MSNESKTKRSREDGPSGEESRYSNNVGRVALVGAGPGDPDWMTSAAIQACWSADVIFYDRLAIPALEGLGLSPEIRLVDVGKVPATNETARLKESRCKAAHRSVGQEAINAALLEAATSGLNVVRLKGGDPMIFGRGGEEASFLRSHGVVVESIPGVSAYQAAACAINASLTHRGVSSSLQLITGHHLRTDDAKARRHWAAQADNLRDGVTLAFYMGMASHERMAEVLLKSGCPRWMPAAVVSNASQPTQKILRTRLVNLVSQIERSDAEAPAIILLGEVLLHSWESTSLDLCSEAPIVVGHEGSVYYGEEDFEWALPLGVTTRLICEASPNASIFDPNKGLEGIEKIALGSVESVVALRDSLAAADLSPFEFGGIEIVVGDKSVHEALERLIGVVGKCATIETVPRDAIALTHHSSSNEAHGPVSRSYPNVSFRPRPDNLRQISEALSLSSSRPLVICDPYSAMLMMPILDVSSTSERRPIFARDSATLDLLQARGVQGRLAFKLKSLFPNEPQTCPTN